MLVSILINNYNYARYLRYCLDSALAQSHPEVEVILYDDGSTDDSVDIAQNYADRIILIANPNYGREPGFNQANAIYQASTRSRGEIICLLDSDDAFKKDKVAEVVKTFQSDPALVLVQHKAEYIDQNDHSLGTITNEVFRSSDPFRVMRFTGRFNRLFYQTSSLSFRRDYLARLLPLPEDGLEKIWADVRLSREAVCNGKMATLDAPLTFYRQHGTNDSLKNLDPVYRADIKRQFQKLLNRLTTQYGLNPIRVSGSRRFYLFANLRLLIYLMLGPDTLRRKLHIVGNLLSKMRQD
ncbi:MAG: glycosyltransferase [Planctomycetes bacterium]|nr:glycosyltransferase [Planctomycetota bacterium]